MDERTETIDQESDQAAVLLLPPDPSLPIPCLTALCEHVPGAVLQLTESCRGGTVG